MEAYSVKSYRSRSEYTQLSGTLATSASSDGRSGVLRGGRSGVLRDGRSGAGDWEDSRDFCEDLGVSEEAAESRLSELESREGVTATTGASGATGASGTSGVSAMMGASGTSGVSTMMGASGTSGVVDFSESGCFLEGLRRMMCETDSGLPRTGGVSSGKLTVWKMEESR